MSEGSRKLVFMCQLLLDSCLPINLPEFQVFSTCTILHGIDLLTLYDSMLYTLFAYA